jgi:hypothetical protein
VAATLRQPGALQQFQQQLAGARMTQPFAASVVIEVLMAAREDPADQFKAILEYALSHDGISDPMQLWNAHRERVAALPEATAAKIELALEQFCKNFAFKDWYLKSSSFARWLQGLFVRVAILRYLIVFHPLLAEDADFAIVETVYSMSRTFEHDDRSMTHVLDSLQTQGMLTLGHAVALLTF